ncbi:hypothetical protein X737_31750 [Mesorhizobium sp. L48C026A00]|nr:hypothetical protein X737_31750 [Mesorhizobium sp. L48C026A00]
MILPREHGFRIGDQHAVDGWLLDAMPFQARYEMLEDVDVSGPVSAVYREFTENLRVLEYDEGSKKGSFIIKFS